MNADEIQELEISLLLDALHKRYGFDFRGYSQASLKRRILSALDRLEIVPISEAIPRLLYDKRFLDALIFNISVTVTEMFRDPGLFRKLREEVVPVLKSYSFINIWHAGCATGEEVYSLAILMREEGLYERAQIFATDLNQEALNRAREGIYSQKNMESWEAAHRLAGGKRSLMSYCRTGYGLCRMDGALRDNVVFANHNLVTDGVFADMNLILCRNVLIYFDRPLQNRVLRLFYDSLVRGGFLCLGAKESLQFSDVAADFSVVEERERIFRKRLDLKEAR